MPIDKTGPKKENSKVNRSLQKVIKLLNTQQLSMLEHIEVLGKLAYVIGGTLAGFREGEKVDQKIIEQSYLLNPSLDLALLLSGCHILGWIDDYEKKPELSNLAEQIRKKEEEKQDV